MENKHFLEKKEQEWNELRLANCTQELSEFEKWDRTKELVEVGQIVIGKVTEHRGEQTGTGHEKDKHQKR